MVNVYLKYTQMSVTSQVLPFIEYTNASNVSEWVIVHECFKCIRMGHSTRMLQMYQNGS